MCLTVAFDVLKYYSIHSIDPAGTSGVDIYIVRAVSDTNGLDSANQGRSSNNEIVYLTTIPS